MNQVATLHKQSIDAYKWVNDLLDATPLELWDETPDVLSTNLTWMTGHLILSYYYHTVMVIVGHRKEVAGKIPLREYHGLFAFGSEPRHVVGKVGLEKLKENHIKMQSESLKVIAGLGEADLDSTLESSQLPHPIAKNKFEAIDWNIKHTMWHCGQIALLKRVIDKPHQFNVKWDN